MRPLLPERQVITEDVDPGLAKSVRQSYKKRRVTIRTSTVSENERVQGLNKL